MKLNKKGFTIVELVIVIAVIAILAAVLIPTFSNVISKANESSVQQAAKTKFEEIYALDYADGTIDGKEGKGDNATIKLEGNFANCTYVTDKNVVKEFTYTDDDKGLIAKFDGENWSVAEKSKSATPVTPDEQKDD